MADYDLTLSESTIPDVLQRPNVLAQPVETVIQQALKAQIAEHLGADRYERTEERAGYRNGHRERQLYTRVGLLTLRFSQSTQLLERHFLAASGEQAFVLGLMEWSTAS